MYLYLRCISKVSSPTLIGNITHLQFKVDRVVRVRLPLEYVVVAPRLVRLVRRLEDQPVRFVAQARLGELGPE